VRLQISTLLKLVCAIAAIGLVVPTWAETYTYQGQLQLQGQLLAHQPGVGIAAAGPAQVQLPRSGRPDAVLVLELLERVTTQVVLDEQFHVRIIPQEQPEIHCASGWYN